MGAAYHILGRTVQPHHLALGTISTVLFFTLPNPFSSKAPKQPEYKAASKEEEKFIQDFLQKQTAEKH